MPEFNTPRRRKPAAAFQKPRPKAARPEIKSRASEKPQKPTNPAMTIKKDEPKSKRLKQRRRQNMAIYYVMFFAVAIGVFAILSATVLFKLEVVETEGESVYSSEEIVTAANIRAGENLLRLDTEESKRRIIEHLVYIDDVDIKKNFPNTLSIQVSGAEEIASIEHKNSFYKISGRGRVLGEAGRTPGLTVIYGFEADAPYIGAYINSVEDRKTELVFLLMNTAREAGLEGIIDINIEDYLDIKMNYMDRIVLHIGPATQLRDKLLAASHILSEEIDRNWRGTLRLLDPLEVVFTPE